MWVNRRLGRRNGIAQVHGSPALADVVAIPGGDLDGHIALHHCLACQARMQGQAGSLIHPVQLIVIRLGKIGVAAFHNHVAGGAGAASSTGVFQLNSEIQRDVQNRLGLTVFVVREFPVFKLDRLAEIDETLPWAQSHSNGMDLAASAILDVHVSRSGKTYRRSVRRAH